jgi:hypothetical protein
MSLANNDRRPASESTTDGHDRFSLSLSLGVTAAGADGLARSGGWRSEASLDTWRVVIHKLAVDEAEESGSRAFQPLAADLQAIPGENQVEYEGIVVALLPRDEASTAVEKAREAGHIAGRFDDWSLELPSHRWDVRDGAGRVGPWEGNAEVESVVLPGLAWVQFAYPIRPEWYELLRECWAEPLLAVPNQAILVFAADLDQIAGCGGLGAYLSLVEPMLSTDRATPELVAHEGPIEVTLTPGSTQEALAAALGPEYEIEDQSATENDVVLLVEGPDAARVLLAEPMVVSLTPAGREPVLSDERQALILARQWSTIQGQGYPQEPASSSSGTYLQWLGNRQLRGLTNQRRIAFFDSGVDSGNPASFHPDLAGRVIHSLDITTSSLFDTAVSGWTDVQRTEDSSTHGTSVIGVGIGAGVNAGRNPTNFAQGQGIAPDATALSLKMWRRNRLANDPNNCGQDQAFGTLGTGHDQPDRGPQVGLAAGGTGREPQLELLRRNQLQLPRQQPRPFRSRFRWAGRGREPDGDRGLGRQLRGDSESGGAFSGHRQERRDGGFGRQCPPRPGLLPELDYHHAGPDWQRL